MNNPRAELQRLKDRQKVFEEELDQLKRDVWHFEQLLNVRDAQDANPADHAGAGDIAPAMPPIVPSVLPPLIPSPPILPASFPALGDASASTSAIEYERAEATPFQTAAQSFPASANAPLEEAALGNGSFTSERSGAQQPQSLEMSLGVNWFARLGVIMLLTALGFFARYAYQRIVPSLGPGGKIGLMYLAGGLLLGTGALIGRRDERLRNYGQVLVAGGFAAIYFTTYAAHYVSSLRVIANPTLAGIFLLSCAALIVFYADRKRSEPTALFAILLAYYTASLHPIGIFTLASNLVLTVAAVFFLVRNRWSALTVASLAASYASYAFWRHLRGAPGWHLAIPPETFVLGAAFLSGYWIIFTVGGLISRNEEFLRYRIAFLTANNTVFFGLAAWDVTGAFPGSFWKVALGFGAVLLALSCLIRRLSEANKDAADIYVAHGSLLITVGFIARFSGIELALILAAESVVLLQLGTRIRNPWYEWGACICAGMSAGWAVSGLEFFQRAGLAGSAGAVALLVFNSWWSSRKTTLRDRTGPSLFAGAALIIAFVATWRNVHAPYLAAVLAIEGISAVALYYWLHVPEIVLPGQLFAAIGAVVWCSSAQQPAAQPPWTFLVLVTANQCLSHWWQRQRALSASPQVREGLQAVFALASAVLIYYRLLPATPAQNTEWLVETGLAAAGLTAYAAITRAPFTALFAQGFVAAMILETVRLRRLDTPVSIAFILPILVLLGMAEAVRHWQRREPNEAWLFRIEPLARLYFWTAAALGLWCLHDAVPGSNSASVKLAVGAVLFVVGDCFRRGNSLYAGIVFGAVAILQLWAKEQAGAFQSLDLTLVLGWLVMEQWQGRKGKQPLEKSTRNTIAVAAGMTVWVIVSRWMKETGGFYITASWSLLALAFFVAGILLRERAHRLLGLCILAFATGRVILFDIWRLEALYRIISFVALGVVLLVLGYLYNRYQERVREWL